MPILFEDRTDAGRRLAARLSHLAGRDPVILALPRGGVPVAAEVAEALGAPLELALVRKIGAPWQPELAVGAVVANGESAEVVLNDDLIRAAAIPETWLSAETARRMEEIERMRSLYLGDRPPVSLHRRDVVVIDDGMATGATMRAVLRAVLRGGPRAVVLAVPVAPPETVAALTPLVAQVIVLAEPDDFQAVGSFYRDFAQVGDDEVIEAMRRANPGPRP
ncbi:MAG: phosphoribosyltransferase [Alphaproteobacteria bacterium]|nr:phosphoribosyltransferase [Alphaproteobacteria bacterium]